MALVVILEAPRMALVICHWLADRLERVRIAGPALVIEQTRRGDDLIKQVPLVVITQRTVLLQVPIGCEVEQFRWAAGGCQLVTVAGGPQMVHDALVGRVVV